MDIGKEEDTPTYVETDAPAEQELPAPATAPPVEAPVEV